MGTRQELHEKLLALAPNAYYQPPPSVRMQYPCFRYKMSAIDQRHANNSVYKTARKYSLTYISREAADDKAEEILHSFQYIRLDRPYTADNLYHYAFELYY